MAGEKTREVGDPIVIRGVGVGRGIAIGPLRFDPFCTGLKGRAAEESLMLLAEAIDMTRGEILAKRAEAIKSVGEEHGEVFDMHLGMLDGGELTDFIKGRIEKGDGLSEAIESARERFSRIPEGMADRPTRAMAAHSREILEILLEAAVEALERRERDVSGRGSESQSGREGYILVSSGTRRKDEDAAGIVCVGGSECSSLASYARARGLPSLVISEADAPSEKFDGALAIIDPSRGRLTVNPDLAALDKFAESARESEEKEKRLTGLIGKPSVTRGGSYLSVMATVSEGEVAAALAADSEGIGVYKTESLFEKGDQEDMESRHFEAYKKALGIFKERPLTVRIYAGGEGSEMGQRGIRYCLARRDLFKAQVRAILRASAWGNISVAIPMAVSAEELRRARAVINECASELRSEGAAMGENIKIGAMIDTPAGAINASALAEESDFFIADTDSLITFTLAADRGDGAVSELIKRNPHPVLKLIGHAASELRASGKGKLMGASGDLAIDPSLTESFLSLGVGFLSVSPPYVLEVRERIRNCP